MSSTVIRISSVSVSMLMRILEATAAHPNADVDNVAEYAGTGNSTAARALSSLQDLGLVRREEAGQFVCNSADVRRGMDEGTLQQIIRRALIAYRPFEAVCEGLALDESLDIATRKASALLGISQGDQKKLDILIRWAKTLNILEEDDAGEVTLFLDSGFRRQVEQHIITAEDVESEVKARLYVAGKLGRQAYNVLDEAEKACSLRLCLTTAATLRLVWKDLDKQLRIFFVGLPIKGGSGIRQAN